MNSKLHIADYTVELIGSVGLHLLLIATLAFSKGCATTLSPPPPKPIFITPVALGSPNGSVPTTKTPNKSKTTEDAKPKQQEAPPEPKPETQPVVNTPATEDFVIPTKDPLQEKKDLEKEKKEQIEKEKQEQAKKEKEKKEQIDKEKQEQAKKEQLEKEKKEKAAQDRAEMIKQLQQSQQKPNNEVLGNANGVEGGQHIVADPSDPILAKYIVDIQNTIVPFFTPLPQTITEHPEYEVIIEVKVQADGSYKDVKVIKSSGDKAFDKAGSMAIYKAQKLPAPPEKWKALAGQGIVIHLTAADAK